MLYQMYFIVEEHVNIVICSKTFEPLVNQVISKLNCNILI